MVKITKIKVLDCVTAIEMETKVNEFIKSTGIWNKATQTHIFYKDGTTHFVAVCYYEDI